MPRGKKTIAREIIEALEEESDEGNFLVLYDFTGKISNYYYKNLKVILETFGDGEWIQKSVIQCKFARTARAIKKLAEHYEAQVLIFRAELLE